MSQAIITDPVAVGEGAINAGEISEQQAHEIVDTIMDRRLVVVGPNAASCCIDGRCGKCMLDGSSVEPGPKVAGGALVTAYAAVELTGWFTENDPQDVPSRMQLVADHLVSAGIKLGGHCDSGARAISFDGKSGCGANDKLPVIIANMQKPTVSQLILGGSELFFDGDSYKPTRAEAVVAQAVNQPVDPAAWQCGYMIDILGGTASPRIEELESKPDATSGHHETLAILNPNKGTTVDRDGLVREDGIQAFVVDTWFIDVLAQAMTRGTNAGQVEELKHAMVAYQIATLATLGDGSHRIAKLPVLQPEVATA